MDEDVYKHFLEAWQQEFVYLFSNLRPGACQRMLENAGQMIKNVYDNYINKLSTTEAHAAYVVACLKELMMVVSRVDQVKLDQECEGKWQPFRLVINKIRDTISVLEEESAVHNLTQLLSQRGPKTLQHMRQLLPFLHSP